MKQERVVQLETHILQKLTTGIYEIICEELGYSNELLERELNEEETEETK